MSDQHSKFHRWTEGLATSVGIAAASIGLPLERPSATWAEETPAATANNLVSPKGTLMLVGGGITGLSLEDLNKHKDEKLDPERVDSSGLLRQFLSLIPQEKEPPEIVCITSASQAFNVRNGEEYKLTLMQLGIPEKNITIIDTHDREEMSNTAVVQKLKTAKGIWIGGGTQADLVKIITNTQAMHAIIENYEDGGVIGATSAGAMFVVEDMIAGNGKAHGELPEMGTGVAMLPGCIVDTHVNGKEESQLRTRRFLNAVKHHPGRVGIGLDTQTALIIRPGGKATVFSKQPQGDNRTLIVFHNGHQKPPLGENIPVVIDLKTIGDSCKDFPAEGLTICTYKDGDSIDLGHYAKMMRITPERAATPVTR